MMGGNYNKIGQGEPFQYKKPKKRDKLRHSIVLVLTALYERLPNSYEFGGSILDKEVQEAVDFLDDYIGDYKPYEDSNS